MVDVEFQKHRGQIAWALFGVTASLGAILGVTLLGGLAFHERLHSAGGPLRPVLTYALKLSLVSIPAAVLSRFHLQLARNRRMSGPLCVIGLASSAIFHLVLTFSLSGVPLPTVTLQGASFPLAGLTAAGTVGSLLLLYSLLNRRSAPPALPSQTRSFQ